MQNLSIGVNVVCEGSPSLILSVRLISFGITIRPRSSTRRTIPVAFIYIYLLILQITLLVSANRGRLYRRIYFLVPKSEKPKQTRFGFFQYVRLGLSSSSIIGIWIFSPSRSARIVWYSQGRRWRFGALSTCCA